MLYPLARVAERQNGTQGSNKRFQQDVKPVRATAGRGSWQEEWQTVMRDLLRIVGLLKEQTPPHVKAFEASNARLNTELDRVQADAFGSMIDDMVKAAREKRRGNVRKK